jgi:archaellum component FlaC
MGIEMLRKTQMGRTLEMENLGKRAGVTDASISKRIQHIEERISGIENTIEDTNTTVKENAKCKKVLTQNIHEIQDTRKRLITRIVGIEESEDSQLK